jgi:hypothetical protein
MNSIVFSELSQDIKKLYALEESIIGDHSESRELRSRQALLLSDVIQSLHKVQATLKAESQVAMVERQTFA